jgi:hypothetical protein
MPDTVYSTKVSATGGRQIGDAMLDELQKPIVSNFIEKAPDVSVKNPIHFLPHDSHPERIQRIMLASPGSETIREPLKVLFVNLIEDRHHGVLDDLVFQRSDP